MRVLISAYSCEPDRGSEPEVGLQAVLAAASRHEVWTITREKNLPVLRAFLRDHPLRDRIHLIGLDVDGLSRRVKKRGGSVTMHWYYDLWQRHLADAATRLDKKFDFDVAHHVTFATYWARTGLAAVDKPFVWGPVGGGVRPPISLMRVMGLRGGSGDLIRVLSRPALAKLNRAARLARRAEVVLTQNPETAKSLGVQETAVVVPNALVVAESIPFLDGSARSSPLPHRIIVAGRLIAWKATSLAITAMQHIHDTNAVLEIYGEGPQRDRLDRLVAALGLTDRVRFMGVVPRTRLLSEIACASALVHPALHDEAGLVVAEALAVGTPVVYLNRGGPPIVAGMWPDVPTRGVEPSSPDVTSRRIASALDAVIGSRGESTVRPTLRFTDTLLAAYDRAVVESGE